MKTRRLDSNHDWTFGNSLSDYLKDAEATKQCVKTRILSFRNNWSLDLDHGIDWFAYFEKNPNRRAMERDLKNNISSVVGVLSINELGLLLDTVTRKLTVFVRYTDTYGNNETVEQIVRD